MKIAICTPCYSQTTPDYSYSLAKTLLWTAASHINFNGERIVPKFEIFLWGGSVLPVVRTIVPLQALEWGANYVLWIDADQAFPEDALMRLLNHNLPIVGANYPQRTKPHEPTAVGLDNQLVWTTEDLANREVVEEVRSLGLGLCLMDAGVLETLRTDSSGKPVPLFSIEPLGDGTDAIGEDVFFFRRAHQAGFKVHVDHSLSWQMGHFYCDTILTSHVKPPPAAENS